MRLFLRVSLLLLLATPVAAQSVGKGDIISGRFGVGNEPFHALVSIDATTGVETVISCWNPFGAVPTGCAMDIGVGPTGPLRLAQLFVSSDGWVYYLAGNSSTSSGFSVNRASLLSGDREFVAADVVPDIWGVVPEQSPVPTVASVGSWALLLLGVGIFIGVQMQMRAGISSRS